MSEKLELECLLIVGTLDRFGCSRKGQEPMDGGSQLGVHGQDPMANPQGQEPRASTHGQEPMARSSQPEAMSSSLQLEPTARNLQQVCHVKKPMEGGPRQGASSKSHKQGFHSKEPTARSPSQTPSQGRLFSDLKL